MCTYHQYSHNSSHHSNALAQSKSLIIVVMTIMTISSLAHFIVCSNNLTYECKCGEGSVCVLFLEEVSV